MHDSLKHIKGNARAALVTQPVWSILGNLFMPFMTLYMLEIGCTSGQVGTINAIGMIVGTLVAVFAGWATDRLGRRRANAIGDLVCWALACLIWGFSQNVIWFIIAACAQAFMRLSGVAWNCILSEGTDPEHRVNIFWWFSIVQTLTIFVTPLMNLLINPFGLVTAMRWVLIGSSIIIAIAVFIRYRITLELPVGIERKEAVKNESPLAAIKAYGPLFRLIKSSPVLLIFISLRTLFFVQVSLKGAFFPITIVHGMGFENGIIGTLNFVTGAIMLISQFILMPKLRTLSNNKALLFSLSILSVSILMLVFAPAHSIVILIISTVLYAAGSVITSVLVSTSLANAMPDKERAKLLSFTTVITVAISAPIMWLGGILSNIPNIGTRLPMLLIVVLFVACIALLVVADKMKKRAQRSVTEA